MIDLDYFKDINDIYGHKAGDTALRVFADATRGLLRDSDHFARMGGEEFAILLPETDSQEGEQIAQRLCQAIAEQRIIDDSGNEYSVTVSIGIAGVKADDINGEAVLGRADRALYAAKQAGRNRVVAAEDGDVADRAL